MILQILDFGESCGAGFPPPSQTFQDGFWILDKKNNPLVKVGDSLKHPNLKIFNLKHKI